MNLVTAHSPCLVDRSAAQNPRQNLIGFPHRKLAEFLCTIGIEKAQCAMRATQIWRWIYHRGVRDFSLMSDIAKPARQILARYCCVDRDRVVNRQISEDGTRKYLLALHDGALVEMVYIPGDNRGSLCVSSQVGCTLNCRFCHTGSQRLVRNLDCCEIVTQLLVAHDDLAAWPSSGENRPISNIVFMGMGEPLYNFDAIKAAIAIIADGQGIGISKRRITISTAGIVPMIERCGAETGANLAISLHATCDSLRDILVPINKKYPIRQLLEACKNYPGLCNRRRVTFEYVMLKGVNDSREQAHALVQLIRAIPAKVNLIPFNPWPGSDYACSDAKTIHEFAAIIRRAGYASPLRQPRGRDIMAACGQLKTACTKPSAAQRRRSAHNKDANALSFVAKSNHG